MFCFHICSVNYNSESCVYLIMGTESVPCTLELSGNFTVSVEWSP